MSTHSLAVAEPAATVVQPARRTRRAHGLGLRLLAALAATTLPFLGLAWLAATHLSGGTALAVVVLAAAGLVTAGATIAWLLLAYVRPARRATMAAARMSAGDLSRPIDATHAGEFGQLLRALEEVRERLFSVVSQVRAGTAHVAMNASQITRDNEALRARTGSQAESLQRTAATMEQMTAAVRQNADTAQNANALVRTATDRAEEGGQVMGEVVATMGSIRQSSQSIRDIIGVIDGIAFQTNILALNAAVEAARAGEQGRGFAVVAAEVRTLAQRCASAAREIRTLIVESADKVEQGSTRVDAAGRAMGEIVSAVRQVADLIGHIDAASREQSDGIEAVNGAIANIDRTTQANASLVEDAARTAAGLQERAVALLKGVARFDLGEREHGNADEAVALVQAGCAFGQAQGRDALIREINKLSGGRFVDRDLYLMVIDAQSSVFLAHGNNPRTLGQGPKSVDVDGKRFVLQMTEVARAKGEGWVDYKWAHPVTNEVLTKSTYVRRAGDVVVACGIYR